MFLLGNEGFKTDVFRFHKMNWHHLLLLICGSAEFILGIVIMYLFISSFLTAKMAQVVEVFPCKRQGTIYQHNKKNHADHSTAWKHFVLFIALYTQEYLSSTQFCHS